VTRAPTDRSHLSIGEVLSLLQDEFPEVTISKIRFLESQGLLDPERTPSGYRKFYEADIDRLRWILRQQKEHFLPLKVIKDRLDEAGPVRTAPTAASPAADSGSDIAPDVAPGPEVAPEPALASATARAAGSRGNGLSAVALDDRPVRPEAYASEVDAAPPAPPAAPAARAEPVRPGAASARRSDASTSRRDVADVIEAPAAARRGIDDDPTVVLARSEGRRGARGRPGWSARDEQAVAAGAPSVSLTAEELIQASGLTARAVRELEGYGLLQSHVVGDTSYYDADALTIARTAAGFLEHGIEARHIRSYKVAVEREAGLYEQIVLPLLKQRNPDARRRADQTVAELVRLGDEMRRVLLRRGLRDHFPPG
jgi:DNA-binding transcriptional MerR regulator